MQGMLCVKIKLDMILNRHEFDNLELGDIFKVTKKMSLAESETDRGLPQIYFESIGFHRFLMF